MKLLLTAALLVCVVKTFAQTADSPNIDNIFTVGYEYKYDYNGQVLSGIPKVSPQRAGLGLKGTVVVQAFSEGAVVVKIESLSSGTVNDVLETVDLEEEPFEYGNIGQNEDSLLSPMVVTYRRGLVQSFVTRADEPEEVTNIKKSILDMLQMKLSEHTNRRSVNVDPRSRPIGVDDTTVYSVMEEGIEGKCENKYSVESNQWAGNPDAKTLNATKILNTDNCIEFIDWLVSTHPANNCTNCDSDDIQVVSNVKTTQYQVSLENQMVVIERIESVGHAVYSPLSNNADDIQTNHSQVLQIVSVKKLHGTYVRPNNTKKHDNLQYSFPELEEGKEPSPSELLDAPAPFFPLGLSQEELHEKVRTLILRIATEIFNDNVQQIIDTPLKIQHLARAARHLNALNVNKIVDELILSKTQPTETPKLVREVAISALVMSGSLPAISVLLDKINHNDVPTNVQERIMHDIPFYIRRPTVPLINKVLRIAKGSLLKEGEQLHKTFWMSLASLVAQSCGPEDSSLPVSPGLESYCRQEDEKRFVQAISEQLEKAKNKEMRVLFVSALHVIKSEHVIDVLQKYVDGSEPVSEMVRVLALRAIAHSASEDPQKVLSLVSPIFADSDETTVLRIAAFAALIKSAPDSHVLEKLAAKIKDEDDDQLTSYVYSSLQSYANSTHPCLKDVSSHALHALSFIEEISSGIQDSGLLINDDYSEDLMLGNILRVVTVGNNESLIPRALQVEFNRSIAGFSQVPLKLTANIEGLSSVLTRLLGPKGAFESLSLEKIIRESYKEAPKNYHGIFDSVKIDPRVDEPLAIAIETQLLTTKRNLYYIDAAKILSTIRSGAQQSDMANLLSSGVKVDYQKIMNLGTVKYQMPSAVGLPIFMQVKSPLIVSVSGKVSVKVERSSIPGDLPKEITIRADIQPTASLNILTSMGVVDPFKKQYVAAGVSSKTYLRLPADISVNLNLHDGSLTTTVKPKILGNKQDARVFRHKVKPFTAIYNYNTFDPIAKDSKPIQVKEKLDEYDYSLSKELVGVKANLKIKSDLFWQDQGSMLEYLTLKNSPLSLLNFWWATQDFKLREYVATVDAAAASKTEFKMVVDLKYMPSRIQNALRQGRKSSLQGLLGFASGWASIPWQCKLNQQEHSSLPEMPALNGEDYSDSGSATHRRSHVVDSDDVNPRVAPSYAARGGSSRWGAAALAAGNLRNSGATSSVQKIPLDKQSAENIVKINLNLFVRGEVQRSIKSKLILTRNKVSRTESFDLIVDVINPAHTSDAYRQICAKGQMNYPKYPCGIAASLRPKNIDPIDGQVDIFYGQTCQGPKKIGIKIDLSQSQKQIEVINSRKMWFYRQCVEDFLKGKKLSDACEQAVLAVSELNKLVVSVDFNNLPSPVLNASYKVDHFMKYKFYDHMSNNPVGVQNGEGKLKVKVIFASDEASVDVKVYKNKENTFFSKIYYPAISQLIKPISNRRSFLIRTLDELTNGYAPPTCKLMNNHVESFENVTYKVSLGECMQVLAKDCSSTDLFSVLVKKTNVNQNKQLDIHLLNHKIQIQPQDQAHSGQFEMMIDNKEVKIIQNEVVILKSEDQSQAIASILLNGDKIVVTAPYKQLIVKFDGENVKVKVGNVWRGSICGMCGEFDGDSSNALIGPQQCEFASTKGFSHSYTVRDAECKTPPQTSAPKLCRNQQSQTPYRSSAMRPRQFPIYHSNIATGLKPHMDGPSTLGDYSVPNSRLRNIRLPGELDLCFSIKPLPQCFPSFISSSTEKQQVPCHCFEESKREFAEYLASQLDKHIIKELDGLPTSLIKTVEVTSQCDEEVPASLRRALRKQQSQSVATRAEDVPNSWPRNFYQTEGEDSCFSILSYPQCRPGFYTAATSVQMVDYHCFDETEQSYIDQLLKALPFRPLNELIGTSVSFTIHKEITSLCSEGIIPPTNQPQVQYYGNNPHMDDPDNLGNVPNTRLRNIRLTGKQDLCFSNFPVEHCYPGFVSAAVEKKPVTFHCFEEYERERAELLALQLESHPIKELETESVTITKNVEVTTQCDEEVPESLRRELRKQRTKSVSAEVQGIPNSWPRNFYEAKETENCFSTASYDQCRTGYIAESTLVAMVDFHCFDDTEEAYVAQLLEALPNRPLTELIGTSVSYSKHMDVPAVCVEATASQGRALNDQDDEVENSVKRNVQLEYPDNFCFSTISLTKCIPSYVPLDLVSVTVPFHCFPPEDADYVKQLEALLPYQELYQLTGLDTTFTRLLWEPTRCGEPASQKSQIQSDESQVENSVMRNRQLDPPNDFCFSTISMTTCLPGFIPISPESLVVPFHCFPPEDEPYVRQLEAALPNRELTELIGTTTTFTKTIWVPTECAEPSTYNDQIAHTHQASGRSISHFQQKHIPQPRQFSTSLTTDIPNSDTRNVQLSPPENFCFSIKGIPKCRTGYVPRYILGQLLPFHCFGPEDEALVRRLQAALPRRELTEMLRYKPTLTRNWAIPIECVAENEADDDNDDEQSRSSSHLRWQTRKH